MTLVLLGSMTRPVVPIEVRLSVREVQLLPPLVVFQRPPPAVLAKYVLLLVGWNATLLMRPTPA